ncbi:MAG: carbamoyltransferase [Verrucomicrobia bacterium]|nr:carbamoyltransferase [Verrucomicrobiota bacterium]
MNILGINAYHGDAAAALVMDGQLVAAAEEERFNRIKHCAGFPRLAIEYCLREGNIRLRDLDHVGVSSDPWANLSRKFWRSLRRSLSPHTWRSAGRLVSMGNIRAEFLRMAEGGLAPDTRLHRLEHHLTHAASAFFVSSFERAAILTLDGFGDFSSGLLGVGEGNRICVSGRIHFPHSPGVFYTALTQYLGFPHYGDEGKVMALASLGKPVWLDAMKKIIRFDPENLIELGLEYFTHHTHGVAMNWREGSPHIGTLYSDRLVRLLGAPRQKVEPLTERFLDVAASMQKRLEDVLLQLARHLAELTGETRICLAGGVALNSVVNGRIRQETSFRQMFIQPAAADDGTALGAAFYIQHQVLGQPRLFVMEHANWGPSFRNADIEGAIQRHGLTGRRCEDVERDAAAAIADGKVVGWFQGRMEFGPRALGNRSILADPRRADMKQILNDRVKHRESFRPFAPSLLEEETSVYFDQDYPSPYMLLVYQARPGQEEQIPGALHVDRTGRLQTVTNRQNARYHRLLACLKQITGKGIVINTSFNDSEPIVCTPDDAIHCFLNTKMDVLFLGDYEALRPPPARQLQDEPRRD